MHFLSGQSSFPQQDSTPSKPYPVHPLYYGVYAQPKEPQSIILDILPTSNCVTKNYQEIAMSQTLTLRSEEYKMPRKDARTSPNDQPNTECDLSLRLGFGSIQRDEIAGLEGSKEKNPYVSMKHKPNESFSLCSGGEIFDLGLMVRKRKAVEPMNDQRCSWQPKVMRAYFDGRS